MKPIEKSKPKSASQQTWSGKYPSEERETDLYWKYFQKKGQTAPIGKPGRAPTTEPMTSFYSSASCYKPQRNCTLANPAYVKYASAEQALQSSQAYMKPKEKRYPPEVTVQRRNRYDTELEDSAKPRYSEEELGNYTEENPEEDAEEEEEQEEGAAYADKDYEEQEADDEIDEESDASPQMAKVTRAGKKEALLRAQQRWRLEQQQNPRGVRYQQVPLGQNYLSAGRYYQNVAEHEACEPLSEEDLPPKVSAKRQPPPDYNRWIQSRSSTDRRDLVHGTRKARTKPDIECYAGDPEFENVRQCTRCGSITKKAPAPVRHHCRFEERLSFPAKGPIGDDPEIRGRSYCRRCDPRQTFDTPDTCEAGANVYAMKPRRSRDVKSPIYETPEQPEKPANYARASLRFSRETADSFPEKTRRSTMQAQPTRLPSRYAEYNK